MQMAYFYSRNVIVLQGGTASTHSVASAQIQSNSARRRHVSFRQAVLAILSIGVGLVYGQAGKAAAPDQAIAPLPPPDLTATQGDWIALQQTNSPKDTEEARSAFPWMWIGIGGGVVVLGLLLSASRWLYPLLALHNFNPRQAERFAQRIMDYDIPGGARGVLAFQREGIQFVGLADVSTLQEISLILGTWKDEQPGLEPHAQQSLIASLWGDDFTPYKYRTEVRQLGEQPVEVTIAEGEQISTNAAVPAVNYAFIVNRPTANILVCLTTLGEDALAKAEQVFRSLRCKG
jgi:hypothetical protein